MFRNFLLKFSLKVHSFIGNSRTRSSLYVNPTRGVFPNIDYANSVYQDYIKVLKDIKFNLPKSKILEVGTGANFLVSFLFKNNFNYVKSIDVSNCLDLNSDIYKFFLKRTINYLNQLINI